MSDIIERLRNDPAACRCAEAADEIERLRKVIGSFPGIMELQEANEAAMVEEIERLRAQCDENWKLAEEERHYANHWHVVAEQMEQEHHDDNNTQNRWREQLQAEIERLRAALEEIEEHGGDMGGRSCELVAKEALRARNV